MINNQMVLIKRELWEHRSIFITPAAISAIMILGALAALMFVGEFQDELNRLAELKTEPVNRSKTHVGNLIHLAQPGHDFFANGSRGHFPLTGDLQCVLNHIDGCFNLLC